MKSILLVEDSELYYNFLRDVIKDAKLLWAKNGNEALEIYKKEKPSLVLVDIILPDVSGIVVIKKIKKLDKGASIIALSGMDREEMMSEAKKAGAKDYIVKDMNIASLKDKILNSDD